MKEFLVYTGLRLALFAGSLGIIVGIWSVVSADGSVPLLWAVVLAFLVSGVASYFLLNAHRERFARKVSERAERATAAFDQRRAAEDADDDAGVLVVLATRMTTRGPTPRTRRCRRRTGALEQPAGVPPGRLLHGRRPGLRRHRRRAGLAARGDPQGRGRREPLRRHPPARLPAAGGLGRRPLPQGRVGPPDRVAEAPAGAVAVPLRAVQRLDRAGDHDHRGVLGLDRGVRGVLRPAARAAVRRGDAAVDVTGEDRADRVPGRPLPPGRGPRHDLRRVAAAGRGVPAGTTSTSSRTPSGPPTGAATTTSPSRSSPSSPRSGSRCRPGWSWAPAPAARRRPSAATSATAGWRPGCAWSTRRTRRSSRAGSNDDPAATGSASRIEGIGRPRVEPSFLPVGGGLHDLGARRRLDRRRPLVHRGDRPDRRRLDRHRAVGCAAPDRRDARGRPVRLGGHAAVRRGRAVRRTPTTTTPGWPRRASTSRRTCARSRSSRTRATGTSRPPEVTQRIAVWSPTATDWRT